MGRSFHATRNEYLLNSTVNLTFDETHRMNKKQFDDWAKSLRNEVLHAWDNLNHPPKVGLTDEQIIRDFERLVDLDVTTMEKLDQQTNESDCIIAPPNIGTGCVSFFPNIQKTKDIIGNDHTGNSLYDLFSKDEHLEYLTYRLKRIFQTDKPYAFSRCVIGDLEMAGTTAKTGKKWIIEFQTNRSKEYKDWDFFIDPVTPKSTDIMPQGRLLSVSKKDLIDLQGRGLVNKKHLTQVKWEKGINRARIKVFKKNQKVVDVGLRHFNIGIMQGGSNFPPAVAKFIYQHFTQALTDQEHIIVYDPSAGFGGRLLGALSLNQDRQIHYVGTDPNPENYLPEIERTRYEYLGTHFNSHIRRKYKTTYDLYTEGSEVIHKNKRFSGYKGHLDFVFTSPPYFAAEGYSEDKNQSIKKFPDYSDWREGFLRKTLETAVEYLKSQRWLAFNIADVQFGGTYYPLEQDTLDILESLGMEYRGKFKMVLSSTPGGNRMDSQTRLPTTKNFTLVNGAWRKYEPIFYFWKP